MSLKDVNRLLKLDPNNTELLAQKQRLLQSAVQDTTQRLETLRQANEKAADSVKKYDAWKRAYDPIKKDIDEVKSKIGTLKDEMKSLEDAGEIDTSNYEELQNQLAEATRKLKDLKKQARQVNDEFGNPISTRQYDALQREIIETERNLNSLEESLGDTESQIGRTDSGFTVIKGTIANLASNVISGAVKKVGELAQSFLDLSESTEEFRTMQAKLEGASDTFGYKVDFAKEKYEQFYKYLKDDQAATNSITNLMGLRVSIETLSNLANSAIGVWSAYGDSIPIESLTESMNESAQVAQVTGVLADALNWAGQSEDDFNKKLEACKNTQERADLIAQTLNATYGKSKEKFDELSGSLLESNAAQLELKDTQAELGKTLEPVNTALIEMKTKSLQGMQPVVEKLSSVFQKLIEWMNKHQKAVTVLKSVIGGLVTALGILGAAFAIQTVIQLATVAIRKMTTSMTALNISMSLNPIVLIVAAIAGLVVAFITLWNKCEGFRNFWINLWETLKTVASNIVQKIKDFFTKTIPESFENFKQKCSETIQSVGEFFAKLPEIIRKKLSEVISAISEWGQNLWNSLTTWVKNAVEAVVQFFKELPYNIGFALGYVLGTIVKWGIELYNYFITTIPKIIGIVVQFFGELPGKIWTWLVNTIIIVGNWVSEMAGKALEMGSQFVQNVITFFSELPTNVWNWLVNTINNVSVWVPQMIDKAKQMGTEFLQNVVKFFSELPENTWKWLTSTINKVKTFVSDMARKAREAGQQFFDNLVNKVKEIPGEMLNIGKNIVSGIWKGISGSFDWLVGKIREFCNGFLGGFLTALGINSPSKVFEDASEWIPEGVVKGVENKTKNVINAIKTMSKKMTTTFSMEVPNGDFSDVSSIRTLNAMVTATSPDVNVNNAVTVQVGNRQFEAYIVKTAQNGITKQQIARNRAKGR